MREFQVGSFQFEARKVPRTGNWSLEAGNSVRPQPRCGWNVIHGEPRVVLVPRTNPGLWAATPLALGTGIRGGATGRSHGLACGRTCGRAHGRANGLANGLANGRAGVSGIPTGFWPPAQGWPRNEAYPGSPSAPGPNRKAVVAAARREIGERCGSSAPCANAPITLHRLHPPHLLDQGPPSIPAGQAPSGGPARLSWIRLKPDRLSANSDWWG